MQSYKKDVTIENVIAIDQNLKMFLQLIKIKNSVKHLMIIILTWCDIEKKTVFIRERPGSVGQRKLCFYNEEVSA